MSVRAKTAATRESLLILQAGLHQAAQLALRDTIKVAVDEAKGTTLWKDQRPLTRSTIHAEVGQGKGRLIAGGASRFLEDGTRPHRIIAVNGRALRFMVNGNQIFRRAVNHPGTAPRPFLAYARDRAAIAASYAADLYVSYAIAHAH